MASPVPHSVRLQLDLARYRLLDNGRPVHLERQPMELLILLSRRRGELVTREDIAAHLWRGNVFVDADQSINRAIRKLRLALHDDPEQPKFLETVVGKGYRFIGDIQITGSPQESVEPLSFKRDDASTVPASETSLPSHNSIHSEGARAAPLIVFPWTRERTRSAVVWLVVCTVAVLLILNGALIWQKIYPGPNRELIQQQLTANPSESPLQAAAISSDGKYLVYSDLNGLYLQLIQSAQVQTLSAPEQFLASNLSWLPDGTGVLASGEQGERGSSIWLISILGGSPHKLRDDAAAPVASPDGAMIAFLGDFDAGAAHGIYVSDVDGNGSRRVAAAGPGEQFFKVAWSPDGQRIAYTESVPGSSKGPGGPQNSSEVLKSTDLDGRHLTVIVSASRLDDFCWLQDGRILYAIAQGDMFGADSNLWVIQANVRSGKTSGQPRKLTNWAGFSAINLSSTRDGKGGVS